MLMILFLLLSRERGLRLCLGSGGVVLSIWDLR